MRTALVIGGSRGLGRGVVATLAASGYRVTAVARGTRELDDVAAATGATTIACDAASERGARELLERAPGDLVVLVAGVTPIMRPLDEHSWDTFTRAWEVDTRLAFEWVRATLLRPVVAHVVVVASGAALGGSPLSGGYAGAKRMQWWITEYAAAEAERRALAVRYHCVLPALSASTELGRGAIHAYAEREGLSDEAYAARFAPALTPEIAGASVLKLDRNPEKWPAVTYRLTGHGLVGL